MKKLLLFFVVAFVSIVSLNGANVTLTTNSSTMGGTTSKSATFQTSIGEFTISMTSVGSHQTDHIRCAKSATFTLTAPENVLMSKVVFNCTGASNNGFPATSNYTKSGAVGTWENSKGENEISLKASDAQTRIKSIEITTIDGGVSTVLGDITVYYGADATPVVNGADLKGIIEGTLFTFSADNAESIVVTNSKEITVAEGTSTTDWTAVITDSEELSVIAKLGEDKKEFSFKLEVVEAPKPVLGDIVVTYGDGKIVPDNSVEPITVEVGTEFTATAENATYITVRAASVVIAKEPNNTVSWSFDDVTTQGVEVTASLEGEEDKVFMFNVQVVEPVVPTSEEYTLVSSIEDLKVGRKYILVGSTENAAKVGIMGGVSSNNKYRTVEDVTDASSTTIHSSYFVDENMDVCPFVIEEYDGAYALKLGKENYLAVKSYSETSSVDLQEAPLGTKNGTYDVTKFTISIAEDGVATIKNGNLLSFNAANSPWRFKSYAKQQSPVYLYKLVVPEIPIFDQMEKVATKVSVTSTKGELHVWTVEYDKDGNAVKENGEDVAASVMAKAPAADDKTWTNWVADEGKEYVIDVPTTAGNYMTIRAKSVLNGIHSEELVKNVDASGNVISGVEGVVADDANAPVEYFNLQGVRVAADQPGIYIRRQGSKVEKVSIAR